MFHEEKIINGILHRRGTPDGEWRPYSIEDLTKKYIEIREERDNLKQYIEDTPIAVLGP